MSKFDVVFGGVLGLTGLGAFATFLVVSVARDFDPVRLIAAFVALAVTKYVV